MKAKSNRKKSTSESLISLFLPDRMRLFFILIFGTPFILGLTFIIVTSLGFVKSLPSAAELSTVKPRLATRLFDDKNQYVTSFFVENREWISLDSLPDSTRFLVTNSIVQTEDRKFYDHWGMNIWAIPVAVLHSVIGRDRLRGASTLTQQLAKNLFLNSERSYKRKIKEAMASVMIERAYSKSEILELYINQVYMGAGCYGFQAASRYYFGKPLQEITLPEAALLAGMLKKPESLRPDRNPKGAKERRDLVLKIMYDEKTISEEQYQHAIATDVLPQAFKTQKEDSSVGVGAYFVEEVRKQLQADSTLMNFYREGLVVQTTMNVGMQRALEKGTRDQLDFFRKTARNQAAIRLGLPAKYHMTAAQIVEKWDDVYPRFLKEYVEKDRQSNTLTGAKRHFPDSLLYQDMQVGAVMIENHTGAIKALVGGYDFNLSKFNRATQALRQPGSSFKSFVYSVAIASGMSPNDLVPDTAISIPDPTHPDSLWKPQDDDYRTEGMIPMRRAFYISKNLPAVNLVQQFGPPNIVRMARKFGIYHPLEAVPAIGLGVFGVTPLEMTAAYTTFPNLGYRMEPYYMSAIHTQEGNVVKSHTPRRTDNIIDPVTAYLMLDMLKDVNLRGTAGRVAGAGFRIPSGGKTGTTNNYTDGWYIGFTEKYTLGIWVGYDDSRSMGHGYMGAQTAVPIWIKTMWDIYNRQGEKSTDFPPPPPGLVAVGVCAESHKAAAPGQCKRVYREIYRAGHTPPVCNPLTDHKPVIDSLNPFLTPIGTDSLHSLDTAHKM